MNCALALARCRQERTTFAVAERLLMRFGASDPSGLARLLADRIDWAGHALTRPPSEGRVCSRREVESFLLSWYGILDPAGLSVRSLVVDGEQAVALGQVRCLARAGGTDLVVHFAASITVGNGVVDACWLLVRVAAPSAVPWGTAGREGPVSPGKGAADTRHLLIASAAELFDRNGFRGTTLDQVCARAGLSKGALYAHFPSKKALAVAVVEDCAPPWHEIARELGKVRKSPMQTLIDLTHEIAGGLATDPAQRASMRLCLYTDLVESVVPAQLPGWISVVRELLVRARHAGELRSGVDARRAAEATVAEFVGSQLLSQATGEPEDLPTRLHWMWRQRLPCLVAAETLSRLRIDAPGSW